MNEELNFKKLNSIDVSEYIEKRKGDGGKELSYLTWSSAWAEIKKLYNNVSYEIKKFENNLPYVYDEKTGYMVFTSVTIDGLTYEMWLPVMNGANKAMKAEQYTYQVNKYSNGKIAGKTDKTVEPATMMDINKTIMRCLVKNLAMFGLGLYIYAGEDLPEKDDDEKESVEKKETKKESLITAEQVEELEKLGVNFIQLAKYYKVADYKDLTEIQGKKAIEQKKKINKEIML